MTPNGLNDFKNWLSKNQEGLSGFFNFSEEDKTTNPFVGKAVTAKVSSRKMLERIECDNENEATDLIADFIEHGGVIANVEGKNLQIEVDTGKFYLPRFCVRISDGF